MLLLDSRQREIGGITVLPDHTDPLQYYYLPLLPHLTTVRDPAAGNAEVPQFSLIRFHGQAGTGGFLNFDVNLGATEEQLDAIRRVLEREERLPSAPRLAPVTTVSGTVKLLMIDPQTGGDGPKFVLKMNHHASPSLFGSNQASFSAQLDAAGVTTLDKSLDGEILPIAVVYSLNYLGLRPAYSIRLNIDWDRVQKHLDEKFSSGFLFSSSEVSTAVDELKESRAIVLEADTFVAPDEVPSVIDRRDAALAQVRSMITEAFFTPSLPPYEPGKEDEWEEKLRVASGVVGAIGSGPAGQIMSTAYFSYTKTDYTRVDRKTLNVNLSERVTVQRSIHPQGHLAGMFRLVRETPLPRERFVIDVDLDDPWFQRRRVNLVSRADFDTDAISSINVTGRYGGVPRNFPLVKGTPAASLDWGSIVADGRMLRPVEMNFVVTFGNIDATERPRQLVSPPFTIEVDNCEIDPRALYAISAVPIVAVSFPWDVYPSVEVHLRYQDEANGLDERDLFRLTAQRPDATWRMFVLDRRKRMFSYRLLFRAADNRDVDTGWKATDEEQITVRDPFSRRTLAVNSIVDWSQVDRAFVDLRYEDRTHGIFQQLPLTFTMGSVQERPFTVPVHDQRGTHFFYYKATFVFKDGRIIEVPESITSDTFLLIRQDIRGQRLVEVRPPPDFAERSLKSVTAELRYNDFSAGLSFNQVFVFESASMTPKQFRFPYVNEDRNRYESRITTLFENGQQRITDWKASAEPVLLIQAP